MDHEDGGDDNCVWCWQTWPCPTAVVRSELAEFLRAEVARDAAYRPKFKNGMSAAADLIEGRG